MQASSLDCSNEVTPVRQPGSDRLVWLAPEVSADDYLIELPPEALAEITVLAQYFEDNPLPVLYRRLDDYEIPACRELMARMKQFLDEGVGFAVLDRLPMDDFANDTLEHRRWSPSPSRYRRRFPGRQRHRHCSLEW